MSLEASLSHVEALLQEVQTALLATDPLTLEKATSQLRLAAGALVQALGNAPSRNAWPEALAQRVQAIGSQLGMQREQLARLLALTERQAASLLPPIEGVSTYGSNAAPRAASGARIYRSPS